MSESWKKVKEILGDALKLAPENRAAFLDKVCDDESLRREVETLLADSENVGSFMEQGAIGEVASLIIEPKKLEAGKSFGHYEIDYKWFLVFHNFAFCIFNFALLLKTGLEENKFSNVSHSRFSRLCRRDNCRRKNSLPAPLIFFSAVHHSSLKKLIAFFFHTKENFVMDDYCCKINKQNDNPEYRPNFTLPYHFCHRQRRDGRGFSGTGYET